MNVWGGIVALASLAAGASAAGAADLSAPAYKAQPPVILSDWSVVYIGINGGYGWGDTSGDKEFDFHHKFDDAHPKGGLFGGQAGYNWQYGKVVTGVEVDF